LPAASPYTLSAYTQVQYESHQDSEDQLQQGGSPLNQDRFLVRRARLRVDGAWAWTSMAIEVDGSTTRGPTFGIRRAEGSVVWRNGDRAPPFAQLTMGLTEIPFGRELSVSNKTRPFLERSGASLAFFPGEPDVGVRLSGGLYAFRYAIGVYNGEPLDDRATSRPARDFNAAKDVVTRFGVDVEPSDWLRIQGGTSFLRGKGFHPGTDATKNTAQWRDTNENAVIDQGEVTAVPGSAATPSQNFDRWGVNADLEIRLRTGLGWSTLQAEATAATNLDRGVIVADPILSGADTREVGYLVAFTQEISRFSLIGLRYDLYDPNADYLTPRAGKLLPTTQRVRTLSPLVSVSYERARLSFQYDFIDDRLARDARGVPVDLRNNRWLLRLQIEL
jgi:hypothetical protein